MAKRKQRSRAKTSPALLAFGAGAAVCLSSTGAQAVSGVDALTIPAAGGQGAIWDGRILAKIQGSMLIFAAGKASIGSAMVQKSAGTINHPFVTFAAGKACSSIGMGSWGATARVRAGTAVTGYLKIRIKISGTNRYGWSKLYRDEGTLTFSDWSFSDTDKRIETLGASVTTRRLELTGGGAMLHFASGNEEGVASYFVEAKRDGDWKKVASFAPGERSYSLKGDQGTSYRLVTERVGGKSSTQEF